MIYTPPGILRGEPVADFSLRLMDPLGNPLRELTPRTYGVAGDVVASVDPLFGCLGLDFSGRPDYVDLEGGEVVQLFLDAGDGPTAVYYGAMVQGQPSAKTKGVFSYVASAEALLNAREMDEAVYINQDVAAIALDALTRNRHEALKIRASDFPPTGLVVPEYGGATGKPLGEVLSELSAIALESGVVVGGGVDAGGFVFFKPNPHILEIPYEQGFYDNLPKTVQGGIVTAVRFVFGGEPSMGGEWAGAYQPTTLSYISTPDPELWERYKYRIGKEVPASAWVAVPGAAVAATNWTTPDLATDETNATPISRTNSANPSTFELANTDPFVFGVRLVYTMSSDVPDAKIRVLTAQASGNGPYYEAELPSSDGEEKTLEIKLPPGRATAAGAFSHFRGFRISLGGGGTVTLRTAHLLRLDTTKLDAVARGLVVVPARRPQQVQPKRMGRHHFIPYLPPVVSQVRLTGGPYGEQIGDVTMLRFGYEAATKRVSAMLDLGQPSGDAESSFLGYITDYVNDRLGLKNLSDANRRPLR
jgi:hypothetical protein